MPLSVPCAFVAVSHTRIEKPMSCTVGVYVASVAPGISTQVARSPTGLHRRQEYVNVRGVEPSHTAPTSESGESTTLPPEICGVTRSFGAIAVTIAVTSEFWDVVPSEFEAVTCTRKRFPVSA